MGIVGTLLRPGEAAVVVKGDPISNRSPSLQLFDHWPLEMNVVVFEPAPQPLSARAAWGPAPRAGGYGQPFPRADNRDHIEGASGRYVCKRFCEELEKPIPRIFASETIRWQHGAITSQYQRSLQKKSSVSGLRVYQLNRSRAVFGLSCLDLQFKLTNSKVERPPWERITNIIPNAGI
jgi:hypothetical protein